MRLPPVSPVLEGSKGDYQLKTRTLYSEKQIEHHYVPSGRFGVLPKHSQNLPLSLNLKALDKSNSSPITLASHSHTRSFYLEFGRIGYACECILLSPLLLCLCLVYAPFRAYPADR
jgi:hypothetical protein